MNTAPAAVSFALLLGLALPAQLLAQVTSGKDVEEVLDNTATSPARPS